MGFKTKEQIMKVNSLQPSRCLQENPNRAHRGGSISKARNALLVASFGFAALPANAAGVFTGFFSFGDSLTDSGNIPLAGGATYPSGRFSNGPTWAEQLSTDYLDLGSHDPSLDGGNNHAFGGAWTDGGALVPSVMGQIGGYLSNGGTFSSTDLVSIFAGANDLFGTIANPGGPVNPGVPVSNIGTALGLLAGAGAQHFLILNLPDLGGAPDFAGGPAEAGVRAWSQGYNVLLADELAAQRGILGISIYEADISGRAAEIIDNPGTYGISNWTDPVFPDLTLDPNETVYWDGVHPTAIVHGFLAEEAFNSLPTSIPEPSTGVLALFAFGIVCSRRTRR